MMMKEKRSRNNKENEDSQELERLKEQIKRMTEKDHEFTDEKAERYLDQREGNAILDARVKGLVECPHCKKIFIMSQWAVHKWKILHKTSLIKPIVYKDENKCYKCLVNGCDWTGSKCHAHFKNHLLRHSYKVLLQTPRVPKVIIQTFILFFNI